MKYDKIVEAYNLLGSIIDETESIDSTTHSKDDIEKAYNLAIELVNDNNKKVNELERKLYDIECKLENHMDRIDLEYERSKRLHNELVNQWTVSTIALSLFLIGVIIYLFYHI